MYRQYKDVSEQIEGAKEMQEEETDPEMKEMIQAELEELKPQIPEFEEKLKVLLIPKDPNDDKNVIMEIRRAAVGDEAADIAGGLFRMYHRYANAKGRKLNVMSAS